MSVETATGSNLSSDTLVYETVGTYQQFIEILPDPLLFCVDGIITLANEAAIKLVRATLKGQVVGQPILNFASPGQRWAWQAAINKIMGRKLQHFTREDCVHPINGDPVDVEISTSHITLGDAEGVVAIFRDITNRKREEERLRESEVRNRTILETTGTIILCLEENGDISFLNTEFEKITGLRRDEIIGRKPWTEFVDPDDRKRMMSYHVARRRNSAKVPRNYECTLLMPDNTKRSALVTVSMIPGTGQSLASIIDLTEIKKTRRILAETEEKHRIFTEMATDCIIIFSHKGCIEYMNRSACELSGLSLKEALGMPVTKILPYHKNVNLYKAIKERKVGSSEVFIGHSGFIRREGENIEVEISTSFIRAGVEPERALVIARDITERRRLEREVLEISERVRNQVGHDLHDDLSPHLIGVEALSEVLKCRLEKKGLDDDAADMDKIRVLINEAITKTHRLARGLCPVDLDATGLVSAINNLAYRICSIYGIRCSFQCNSSIENIGTGMTSLHLYYITHEAINNAVKHSGASNLLISLSVDSGNLVLTVADDGKGITKKEDAGKERRRDDGVKGGMGLRIMQHRAEIIRASLEIGKNGSGGTLVRCSVPLVYIADR